MDVQNEHRRHRVTLYRERKRRAGICLHCKAPALWADGAYRVLCEEHMRRQVEYNNRSRAKRKEGQRSPGSAN